MTDDYTRTIEDHGITYSTAFKRDSLPHVEDVSCEPAITHWNPIDKLPWYKYEFECPELIIKKRYIVDEYENKPLHGYGYDVVTLSYLKDLLRNRNAYDGFEVVGWRYLE